MVKTLLCKEETIYKHDPEVPPPSVMILQTLVQFGSVLTPLF